jgi:hypothetical protein
MKKFIVKSGFIAKENENDKKGKFVERSSIEVEAESKKHAERISTNMSLFERKKLAWDPMAGPTLQIEEVKPENTQIIEVPKDQIDDLNLSLKEGLKDTKKDQIDGLDQALKEGKKDKAKELLKESMKDSFKEQAKEQDKEPTKEQVKELAKEQVKTKKGPGRPRKNPQ